VARIPCDLTLITQNILKSYHLGLVNEPKNNFNKLTRNNFKDELGKIMHSGCVLEEKSKCARDLNCYDDICVVNNTSGLYYKHIFTIVSDDRK
jgi:hypothetical protein